jgi:hypothetical protein
VVIDVVRALVALQAQTVGHANHVIKEGIFLFLFVAASECWHVTFSVHVLAVLVLLSGDTCYSREPDIDTRR